MTFTSTPTLTATKLYLDFETTSLDETTGAIAEVGAAAVTDDLLILDTYQTPLRLSDADLSSIEATPVVKEMFTANGLLEELRTGAKYGVLPTLADVEQQLIAFIDEHAEPGIKVTLSGSGVATFDFRWIRAQMPELAKRLTYWTSDIGVIRRFWREATGGDLVAVNTTKPHRGMDDVLIHIEEARAFDDVLGLLAEAAGGSDYDTVMAFLTKAAAANH